MLTLGQVWRAVDASTSPFLSTPLYLPPTDQWALTLFSRPSITSIPLWLRYSSRRFTKLCRPSIFVSRLLCRGESKSISLGAEEMVQWLKHLPLKFEDLSLDFQSPHKCQVIEPWKTRDRWSPEQAGQQNQPYQLALSLTKRLTLWGRWKGDQGWFPTLI